MSIEEFLRDNGKNSLNGAFIKANFRVLKGLIDRLKGTTSDEQALILEEFPKDLGNIAKIVRSLIDKETITPESVDEDFIQNLLNKNLDA